jgi:NapC/NirT cytochrome c family, N-terminal region/Doubled CXXCH motif (Paired_CXXCH_1)
MTLKPPSATKKSFHFLPVLGGIVALGVILAASGFTFAASQETHDAFCASCHTQPESTFFQRSTAAQAVDLASYHTAQQTRCIDCHSGQGIIGRMQAEVLGARNALAWYTHTAVQPAPLNFPISDANCLKCHQDVTQQGYNPKTQMTVPGAFGGREGEGRNNHWHVFLARWQAASSSAGTCTSCHNGHSTQGNPQNGFMIDQTVRDQCDACHQVLRRGEGGRG